MDENRVERVALGILELIRANYLEGPIGRERVFENLNSLGIVVATILAGCDDPIADQFFSDVIRNQREGLLRGERN